MNPLWLLTDPPFSRKLAEAAVTALVTAAATAVTNKLVERYFKVRDEQKEETDGGTEGKAAG